MKINILIALLFAVTACKKEECAQCVETTTKTVTNGKYVKGYPQTTERIFSACNELLEEKRGENSVGKDYYNGYELTVKTYTTCK